MLENIKSLIRNKFFPIKNNLDNYQIKHLVITLTYQCQLSCKMCGQVNAPEDAPNSQANWTQIPIDTIIGRINELKNPLRTAYLFGGEPLIYKDIFKLSKFLNEKKVQFSYSTNGLLLKKYVSQILQDSPHMISVSLDGYSPELHDEIRGLKGSWKKALEGLEELIVEKKKRNLNYPLLKIHFTITPDNFKTMRDYYNYYIKKFPEIDEIKFHVPRFADTEMGINYVDVMQKEFNTNCLSYLGNFSDDKFVKECKEKIEVKRLHDDVQWLLEQPKVAFLGPTAFDELDLFFKRPGYYPRERRCVCFNSAIIQPNGDVVSCGDYPDLIFGNIKNNSIDEAWKSEKAIKWRSFLDQHGNPGVLAKCSRLFKTIKSSNY